MNNVDRTHDRLGALLTLSDILREAADRHGGDYAATWSDVCSRIEEMSSDDRAQLDAMLRSILRFESPPSRAPQ